VKLNLSVNLQGCQNAWEPVGLSTLIPFDHISKFLLGV